MKSFIGALAVCFVSGAVFAPPVAAHRQLGTPLKKRYELRSVSCNACHMKGKKKAKTDLTAFGSDIAKLVEGKMVSERIEAAKDLEHDEQMKVLDQITKEYTETLDKLDKMKAPSGKPYSEALPAGEIEGAKPRK